MSLKQLRAPRHPLVNNDQGKWSQAVSSSGLGHVVAAGLNGPVQRRNGLRTHLVMRRTQQGPRYVCFWGVPELCLSAPRPVYPSCVSTWQTFCVKGFSTVLGTLRMFSGTVSKPTAAMSGLVCLTLSRSHVLLNQQPLIQSKTEYQNYIASRLQGLIPFSNSKTLCLQPEMSKPSSPGPSSAVRLNVEHLHVPLTARGQGHSSSQGLGQRGDKHRQAF